MNTQIARTIIEQLGGGQFAAMVGLKHPVAHPMGVQFSIGHGAKNGINKVVVMLTPADVYTMQFFHINARKAECELIAEVEEVYCDMLQDIFEDLTGFYTTLYARG